MTLSTEQLNDFLALGYIPSANAQIPESQIDGRRSWADAVREGREILAESVRRACEASPNGVFMLSGGIDSGTVLGLAPKDFPRRAVTVAFDDEDYDESPLTRLTAEKNHAELEVLRVGAEIVEQLPELLRIAGAPFADSSLLASAYAMKHCGAEAVITGDGGDELFGGYRRYQAMILRHRISDCLEPLSRLAARTLRGILPSPKDNRTKLATVTRMLWAFSQRPVKAYASFQEVASRDVRRRLLSKEPASDYTDVWQREFDAMALTSPILKYNALDLMHYLPDDGCRKQSIAAEYAGVKLHSPILDDAVREFALTLPLEFRTTSHETKRVMRAIGAEFLPSEVLCASKRGFGIPLAKWFRTVLTDKITAMAESADGWDSENMLNHKALRDIVQEHIAGAANHAPLLWALFCLKTWTSDAVHNA